ncbi:MAG: AI-2E family transporter, partial [Chloroflexota bacterium]|nr:AI-2E family transporter [Chloroflexota bacterium]
VLPTPAAEGDQPRPRPVALELRPLHVFRAAVIVAAVVLGVLLVWRIQEVLFLLAVAILLATALEPLVNALRRGPFTRGIGVLVIYTLLVLAIGIPTYLALPGVLQQTDQFIRELPGRLEGLRPYARSAPAPIQQAAESVVAEGASAAANPAPPSREQLLEAGVAAAHAAFNFIMVFVVAFYWLLEHATLKGVLLRALPARMSGHVDLIWAEVEEKLGGWVRGQLLLMLAIGVMSGAGYWALGLPNPLILAVLAALFEIVPLIGPILSSAPAVLVALSIDPVKALLVVGYALIIQQIENNVLVPRVMGRTVGISPLVVLVGILVGAALYGIPGAFLAVPVAGALQVVLGHVLRDEACRRAPEQCEPARVQSKRAE